MRISLLLPGLLDRRRLPRGGHTDVPGVDLSGLEWLLTLARRRPLLPDAPEARVASYADGVLPAAALSYFHDFGEPPPGPVLRADPVNLEADRDCVRLLATELGDLDLDSAGQLVDEINDLFADEPWRLVPGTAQRWYLLLEDEAGIRTQPPEPLLGANIHDALPTGERARYWLKIINEIQMLLFGSAINQRRLEQGRMPANSLWLWGEGQMTAVPALPWSMIYTDDPVIAGLGRRAGTETAPAPARAEDLLQQVRTTDPILCQPALTTGFSALTTFNDAWAWPLYKALQQRRRRGESPQRLDGVELLPANGYTYRLAAGTWSWWRRRRRLGRFLID